MSEEIRENNFARRALLPHPKIYGNKFRASFDEAEDDTKAENEAKAIEPEAEAGKKDMTKKRRRGRWLRNTRKMRRREYILAGCLYTGRREKVPEEPTDSLKTRTAKTNADLVDQLDLNKKKNEKLSLETVSLIQARINFLEEEKLERIRMRKIKKEFSEYLSMVLAADSEAMLLRSIKELHRATMKDMKSMEKALEVKKGRANIQNIIDDLISKVVENADLVERGLEPRKETPLDNRQMNHEDSISIEEVGSRTLFYWSDDEEEEPQEVYSKTIFDSSDDEIYFSDEEAASTDLRVKIKGLQLQPSQETIADKSRLESVFGGNTVMMPHEHWHTSISEKHRDITASARVEKAPSLRGDPQQFEAAVNNIKHQKHDAREFHDQIKSQEMKVNQHKIETMAEPIPQGDLTTPANVASVNRNASQMHHRSQRERRTGNVREGRTEAVLQKLAPFISNRKSRHSKRYKREPIQEPSVRRRPYHEHSDPGLGNITEQVINLFVHKDPKKPGYYIPVRAEPYCRDMDIPKEHWSPKCLVLIENHQLELSRRSAKERRAFFKQLLSSTHGDVTGRQKDARIRQRELQQLTTEEMNSYIEEFKLVDTSPFETRSVVQSDAQDGSRLTVHAEIHPPPKALRETRTEPDKTRTADKAAKKQANKDGTTVQNNISCLQPPKKKADTDIYNNLPCSYSSITRFGDAYGRAMMDSMLAINPSYELKIGQNIFCTKPKPQDMLCSVHSTITALMNLDSIRHAASLKGGPIGEALTRFTECSAEPDKYELVQWLADELCSSKETLHQDGQDAAVVMKTLLERLFAEKQDEPPVFCQDLEVQSTCSSCGGERTSRHFEMMSLKSKKSTADDRKAMRRCLMGPDCTDGEIYQTNLLNCPDAVVQVVACRRDSGTYKLSEEVPYQMGSAPYELKFCVVHLGSSRMSGHFVTLLTNPLDRQECVLVDDGRVRWLKREDFEKFAQMSYINGYEIVEPQTIPKPSTEDMLSKMNDAMQKRIRTDDALKSISFFKGVSEYMNLCEYAIDKSFRPIDVKETLIGMLQKKTYGEGDGPLLREEQEANSAALLLRDRFMDYEQLPWSFWKKIRKVAGFYSNSSTRDIRYIEMLSERYKMQEREDSIKEPLPISKSKVLGTGVQPGIGAKDRFVHHSRITEDVDDNGRAIFKCSHCGTKLRKQDMKMHIEKGRCAVLKILLEHASTCQRQNGDEELFCGRCEETDVELLFECHHCQTTLCAADMKIHIEISRCAVNRRIYIGFRHTPRKHGRGEWRNDNLGLSVIRPQASGNRTQYILEETDRATLNWVVRTSSPSEFTARWATQKGTETIDGTKWLGEGYSEDDKHLVGAKEEVMYKDNDAIKGYNNVPVWSLVSRFYRVREIQDESGGVNLNVHGHPAKNPDNLEFEQELELIQVGSGDSKDFRMVVRRKGKKDEELTFVKHFEGNDEKPTVDDNILQRMTNWSVNMKNYVNKPHLEFEQSFKEVSQPNVPYKFMNSGENLCWVNSATQIFLWILPNIARDLSAVMKQDSTLSGMRDLPKLLVETIANSRKEQSLAKLRNLVMPGNDNSIGSALEFFEEVVKMLNKQAPKSVKGLSSEKLVSDSRKSCPTVACAGTFEPRCRSWKSKIFELNHDEQKDGRSAQNCINRNLKESAGPFLRSCTNGHEHNMQADVAFPKLPELFLMTAYGGTLDQESSMEVRIQGKTFRAEGIIHHLAGGPGHHFCSLFDATKEKWSRIDDYHPSWKESYHYSETEKAFKVGSDKLFDNLGVVCYKLKERDSNQEPDINIEAEGNIEPDVNVEPEANDIGYRCNFHTATTSGQQVLVAKNTGHKCYVIADMAALLGNPHIHQIFRSCAEVNPTKIEKYLQKLCHSATGTIVQDIEAWKQQVVKESSMYSNLIKEFRHDTQQDAMEFLQAFIQTICYIEDTVDIEGNIIQRAPLSTQTRKALKNILGHTTTTTTTCTELGCKKNVKEVTNEIVLSLDVNNDSKKSVNSCLNAQLQMTEPYPAQFCETCSKRNGNFQQQHSVSNLKKCAILQLKRFQDHNKKNTRSVIVDEVLEEGPYCGYLLTGAILHEGKTLKSGHYTHILRDVESGRWFKTDDNNYEQLNDEVARNQLKGMGYILFYSLPDQFPPPLKGLHERRAQASTRSTRGSRKEPVQRKSFFAQAKPTFNHIFKTHDGPTHQKVKIPEMPAPSNLKQSEVCTPTEQEIAVKIKTNSKNTHQRIIDANNPLAVTLKAKFGHDDFRSREQMEATKAIIGGKRDVVIIMSTGEIFLS